MTVRGRITAIQPQKAYPDRVSLFVNGEYVLGIRRELAYHLHIREGQLVTEEDLAAWQHAEAYAAARDLAVKYLAGQARSIQQVVDYLRRKGIETDVAADTIQYLETSGYLNEAGYAESFVNHRMQSKPRGKRMIRWELQQKGISEQLIDKALMQYEDEAEVARRLISKKTAKLQQAENADEWRDIQRKLGRYLMSKGFSLSTIRIVMQELKQGRFTE
jgi:regulatory protein